MRDQILALIEPKVRELAEQLTETIVARVAVMVGQLEFAFEAAASSFQSDLARGDMDLGGEGADAAPEQTPLSTSRASSRPSGDSGRAAAPARTDGVRGGGRLSPRMAVPEPAVAAEQGSTSPGRKPNSCRKCGAVGFTAATCGKTHNASTSPASAPPRANGPAVAPVRTPATSITRSQRSEAIALRAALLDAPPRRSRPDSDDEPVLPFPENPQLPAPRSSWDLDGDFARELGEPERRRRGRPRKTEVERRQREQAEPDVAGDEHITY